MYTFLILFIVSFNTFAAGISENLNPDKKPELTEQEFLKVYATDGRLAYDDKINPKDAEKKAELKKEIQKMIDEAKGNAQSSFLEEELIKLIARVKAFSEKERDIATNASGLEEQLKDCQAKLQVYEDRGPKVKDQLFRDMKNIQIKNDAANCDVGVQPRPGCTKVESK